MKDKKLFLETWGCQLNSHRSEKIAGHLESFGYTTVNDIGKADLIVFNTCAVRDKSEEKVRGRIGQIKEERKEHSILGVGGCMAQHLGETLLNQTAGVDFVFGTSNLKEIPDLAKRARNKERAASITKPKGFENLPVLRKSDYFAWVTIAEGCSNACSYCIVPQVRGGLRSRSPEKIIEEIETLVHEGYKEVQLLGQNVNAFGEDIADKERNFAWLLEKVADTGIPRISFTTPHPADLDRETLRVMSENENIVRHIHLPLQSGSNQVLEIMKRGYTKEKYLTLIDRTREVDPLTNVTTDIIVGHPGETREEFKETLDVIRKVKFGSIYVAQFSPRPDTKSAEMENHVSESEKKRRLQLVLEKQKEYSSEYENQLIGMETDVLVKGPARKDGNFYGKNEFGETITFKGKEAMIGEFVKVIIEKDNHGKLASTDTDEGSVKNDTDSHVKSSI
ncbi:tRNA (N6-isopentenyl adenosine(37)-C2)-methylthiotransferase MiaB [Candidatus Bipolaricaulota bacterium]|nr:tRNA (N6-isopentenyl adenosine(37)-C2)-methylthiotransferase MiaB [Candidatus Bipolaricaulota bacterium]